MSKGVEAGWPWAHVKVRESPACVEGEPLREVARTQAPGCPQAASPFPPCSSPASCTRARQVTPTSRSPGGRHYLHQQQGWHLDKQPTAGHQDGLEDPAPHGDIFLSHFLVPWPEWSSPRREAWQNRAEHGAREAQAQPWWLASLSGLLYQAPPAALPEFSFLLWGFFLFHLCSTLSSLSGNVKGHQEAFGLRRSATERLLWAEWPTSVTREEVLRTEAAASAPEAVSLGHGTWTAWLSYSECLRGQRDSNPVGIAPDPASHVP